MSESAKELIWVPSELKAAYEKCKSEEEQKKIFFRAIEERKLDIKNQIEYLDDELLLFKGFGIKYKTELEKVYQEQATAFESLWEKYQPENDKLFGLVRKAKQAVDEISNKYTELNKSLNSISTYQIERLISIIDKFNSMTEKDKELLKILLEKGE